MLAKECLKKIESFNFGLDNTDNFKVISIIFYLSFTLKKQNNSKILSIFIRLCLNRAQICTMLLFIWKQNTVQEPIKS
jgi:hypothetical protein